ncbi:hypothetical protein HOP50_03g26100 [Chloropicon primus]|uniref:EF-hand domain-containing protein n=1 Tax=Chloropicon primus TaxID=1764295 RepID=A0A5B8MIH5_9CHLO|nr:hypothetical protein A3770_03p26090 [Chloropicon primus]UPQ99303.1 hypothetical protein HOP50_03g26100 [Chloropicon primus]|eukprot:QDZ20091.1 hypothetical protein A3770_03p26090 [Chloropicon primus]
MTTASPVPPLVEHTGGNSYHIRRKSLRKALSARGGDDKENRHGYREGERDAEDGGEVAGPSKRRSLSQGHGRRKIKSAGTHRREVYKTHKAEIQFPVPHAPTTSGSGSPRKGRLANGRCSATGSRKSRSAAASLFNLEPTEVACGRAPAWPEENFGSGAQTTTNLNETIYGLPAYGTPTLALRERTALLEKEREELLYKLRAYEEALLARDREVETLKERVQDLEENAQRAEEERAQMEEEKKRLIEAERQRHQAKGERRVCENCVFLTEEVDRSRGDLELMQQEYQKMEFAFEESEAQKSEYEKRCYFLLLDPDSDGLIQLPDLATHEVLLPYPPELLEICFTNWNYQSGIRNVMSWEDFSLFFQYVEDKKTKASQNYWFNVLDIDGDGYVGIHDMRWLYDKVDKSEHQGCIEFEDLLCQLYDMARPKDPARGFTLSELRKSKLCTGIIGILTNHNHMLLRRSTSEWATGNSPDLPL